MFDNRNIFYLIGSVFLIFSGIYLSIIYYSEGNRQFLTVAFLDVGQGDSIFIEAPNGNQLLIDSGQNSMVISRLSEMIPFFDREIDFIIETHSDSDHVGGFPEILKRFKVLNFGFNGVIDNDSLNTEIKKNLDAFRINQIILGAGDKIILDFSKNIFVQILWPAKDKTYSDNNEYSVVCRIVYGNTSFILTGDLSKSGENMLSNIQDINIKSDVLKAGHHGSKNSTSEVFLEKVRPDYVVISAGQDNKFGHPDKEVIDLIKKSGANMLETSKEGPIIFQSDGNKITIKK